MNKVLSSVQTFFNNLSRKQFYQALGFFFGAFIIIIVLFGWLYYRSLNGLYEQFELINDQRKVTRKIVTRKQQLTYQRKEIDTLLAQEPTFNIAQYFTDLVAQFGLDKKTIMEPPTSEEKEGYRADTLRVTLSHITTQELTTVLQEIEKKERIYLTEIDIRKSSSPVNTIDVTLTMITWQLSAQVESEPEGASS